MWPLCPKTEHFQWALFGKWGVDDKLLELTYHVETSPLFVKSYKKQIHVSLFFGTLSKLWQRVRWDQFNNSSCSEDRHVKFCPCQGSLKYSMKLSRINAISGDIVCTQPHSAWHTERNAACPCGVSTKCCRRGIEELAMEVVKDQRLFSTLPQS